MEERATAPGGFIHSDPVRAAELLAGWVEGRAGQVRAFLRERDLKVGELDSEGTGHGVCISGKVGIFRFCRIREFLVSLLPRVFGWRDKRVVVR